MFSLDTLDLARFERITRRRGHEAVMKSLDTALALLAPTSTGVGLRRVKLNVVVVKGVNDDEVFDFLELTRNKDLSVRFIEFMPFSGKFSFLILASSTQANRPLFCRQWMGQGSAGPFCRSPGSYNVSTSRNYQSR